MYFFKRNIHHSFIKNYIFKYFNILNNTQSFFLKRRSWYSFSHFDWCPAAGRIALLPTLPSACEQFLVASISSGADDDLDDSRAFICIHLHVLDGGFLVQPTVDEDAHSLWMLPLILNVTTQWGKPALTLTEECWGRLWGLKCVFLWSLQSLLPPLSSAHRGPALPRQIWAAREAL